MEIQELIARAEQNIRTALEDYGRHTEQQEILEDVTDAFIHRLAKDSTLAKQKLRELFSKSPAWDPELDAIVINGSRTHEPDSIEINALIFEIFIDHIQNRADYAKFHKVRKYFTLSKEERESDYGKAHLRILNDLAPHAYHPGKKMSRVFRDFCRETGIADETKGSKFQRLYAQLADEMNSRKIDFKLFVSINPAHFLTMSNPKEDERGETLTSCHSFNRDEYDYIAGCSGYARDETSFIVFTVDDPSVPELLNNRKTTRQIFAYRPGSGLLLQSRMYNTEGGVYGKSEITPLYRDLIQRELSDLENTPNLWKTYSSTGDKSYLVKRGKGFGGYLDWECHDFDCHISIRSDCSEDPEPLTVGAYGLCVVCGEETRYGAYCSEHSDLDIVICPICGEMVQTINARFAHYDGREVEICDECLDEHFVCCDSCNEYYPRNELMEIDGEFVCNECAKNIIEACRYCGKKHLSYRMSRLYTENGIKRVCGECEDRYPICSHCWERISIGDDGTCPSCGAQLEETTQTEEDKEDCISWDALTSPMPTTAETFGDKEDMFI